MTDIETRDDIDRLMRVFYDRALVDDVIGYIFTDVAKLDLVTHLPIIVDFWDTVVFNTAAYAKHGRNPLMVHKELDKKLELTSDHFDRWLEIFSATTDEMFVGQHADFLKMRSVAIAARMRAFLSADETPAARPVEIGAVDRHP